MAKHIALISNDNVVVNTIVVDDIDESFLTSILELDANKDATKWAELPDEYGFIAMPGWTYDGSVFYAPIPEDLKNRTDLTWDPVNLVWTTPYPTDGQKYFWYPFESRWSIEGEFAATPEEVQAAIDSAKEQGT